MILMLNIQVKLPPIVKTKQKQKQALTEDYTTLLMTSLWVPL